MIVGMISQKGGVGKSTLTRALAYEASRNGLSVKIADLDIQQGTTVNWYRRRLEHDFEPIGSVESFKTVSHALKEADKYDLLILDGQARTSSATLEIARVADLIVQPTGVSIDDLEPAILTFHELVKAKIPKEKIVLALCRVGTLAELRDSLEYIEKSGYTALSSYLPEKPTYRQAQNMGLSVMETRYESLNNKADTLIQSLIDHIL